MKYAPMLLSEVQTLPQGPGWGFEGKWDGWRMMGEVSPERIMLLGKQGSTMTDRYPDVALNLVEALDGHSAVVDGEVVGFGPDGLPSYSALRRKDTPVTFFLFDLLELDGESITHLPLIRRRLKLEGLLKPVGGITLSKMFYDPADILDAARSLEMEGVVAKKLNSQYVPGRRLSVWQKLLLRSPEERQSWNRN